MASSSTTRFAVLGGLLLAGAVGGLYGLRTLQQTEQLASPAPVMPQPASPPVAAALPSPVAAPSPIGPAISAVPTVNFTSHLQRYSLLRDDAAYIAASLQAPQLYPLARGTPIVSAARSDDGSWIIALTQDGQAAYVPTSALGPYDAAASPLAPSPSPVAGAAQVLDTATLSVDGQQLGLVGVKGVGGELAAKLQQSITSHGGTVTCVPQAGLYSCTLADGVDVARLALYNGAAEPTTGASADYRQQADAARAGHRGLWR